jgi:hypothetical protein
MINFGSALELLRTVRNSANEAGNAPVAQGLLDLQGQLLHLQVQMLEQQFENRSLQNETIRLRTCRLTERKMQRSVEAYVIMDDDSRVRGPYCVGCWETRDVLQELLDAGENSGYCPRCKVTVNTMRTMCGTSSAS